jgi:MRG-binding protein
VFKIKTNRYIHIGMHKHFRMLSIHNSLLTHGFASPNAPHTRIPGIWAKLRTLYDLGALDERENAYMMNTFSDPDRAEDELPEFHLPEDEFGEDMWTRRFADSEDEGAESPPEFLPTDEDRKLYHPGLGLLSDLHDSLRGKKDESHASPSTRPRAGTRGGRGAAKGRAGKAAQATKGSKAQSAVSETPEEEEEEEESSEEESEDSESEEVAPAKGARGGRRGRPARRARKR